jgi:hypothetical protein
MAASVTDETINDENRHVKRFSLLSTNLTMECYSKVITIQNTYVDNDVSLMTLYVMICYNISIVYHKFMIIINSCTVVKKDYYVRN